MRKVLALALLLTTMLACENSATNGGSDTLPEIYGKWILEGSVESSFGISTLQLAEDGTYVWDFMEKQGNGNFTIKTNEEVRTITFSKDPMVIVDLNEDSLVLFQKQDTLDRTWHFYKEK